MSKPLLSIPLEDGMEVRVYNITQGYSVVLHDVDADITVPYIRIFPTFEQAKDHAETFKEQHNA
jgi:hypothetical protein